MIQLLIFPEDTIELDEQQPNNYPLQNGEIGAFLKYCTWYFEQEYL